MPARSFIKSVLAWADRRFTTEPRREGTGVTERSSVGSVRERRRRPPKATIIAKDNARNVAETLCRDYAILIKENGGIADEAKVNAGVRPINPNREPIECPQTQPILAVIGQAGGRGRFVRLTK